ncbi:MAG: DinB family protein, partial [Candidatus Promineifilaceae bacterium]
MNSIMTEYYPVFELYQSLRDQLMALLEDDDLAFRPGEHNPTLGALCREMGEVQYAYIQSFTTFKMDFSFRNEEPDLESNVEKLRAWLTELDGQLKEVVSGLSEEDVSNRMIDRGPNFTLPPRIQLDVYKEALLIFYGKVSVYLRMMA